MDLVKATGVLAIEQIPTSSEVLDLSFPRVVVLWLPDATITAVGDIPTPAELQTAIDNGLAVTTGRMTNGTKPSGETQQEDAAATEDGLPTVYQEFESISGNLKMLNNDVLLMWAKNNFNNRVRFGFVDDNGHWNGGKEGFHGSFYTKNYEHGGYGSGRAFVPFTMKWERDPLKFVEISEPDAAYLELTNFSPAKALLEINAMAVANNAATLTILMLKQAGAVDVITAKLADYKLGVVAAAGVATTAALQTIVDTANLA